MGLGIFRFNLDTKYTKDLFVLKYISQKRYIWADSMFNFLFVYSIYLFIAPNNKKHQA